MNELPISHILDDVKNSLNLHNRLVVVAPPGAGKSTLLPLTLLDQLQTSSQQIWLLEPRRLAAFQVASRLASTLGQTIGQDIGLITGESNQSKPHNKLVVMTEGVLIQRLLKQNDISNCAMVLFDEFHERSLQSDLALALSVQCQDYLRDDLKLLIMSATLDSDELEQQLSAQVLISEGRSYPVDVQYRSSNGQYYLCKQIYNNIQFALNEQQGDVLVFLPGVKEINQTFKEFSEHEQDALDVFMLHGNVNGQTQKNILKPTQKRKIILATDIAKTSLTIEGIEVVIDSGLERLAQFNVKTQMNELVTIKASQASCIQRAGRAGRLQAGICYRLFSQDDFNSRDKFSPKAIETEDLSQFTLSLSAWGSINLDDYFLLNAPHQQRFLDSIKLLSQLNILSDEQKPEDKNLTAHGKAIYQLPLHPRLSHMLMATKTHHRELAFTACYVAAILSEGDPLYFDDSNSDLEARIQLFESSHIPRGFMHGQVKHQVAKRIQQLAKRLSQMLSIKANDLQCDEAGLLLMLAYPDRLAQKRGKGYRLSQGQGCQLMPGDALPQHDFLAVAHVSNQVSQTGTQSFIRLAAPIQKQQIFELNEHLIEEKSDIKTNEQGNLINVKQTCLGQLVLSEKQQAASKQDQYAFWLQNLKQQGLSFLNFKEADTQVLSRLNLAHQLLPDIYPSFDENILMDDLENWLLPFINEQSFNVKNLDIKQALLNRLDWNAQQSLNQDLPLKIELPSGRSGHIDYQKSPPVVSCKLQECFGLLESPRIARNRLTITLHLLSPAQRPLAQTSDLAFFWKEVYPDVRKENRGRYAKHPWPEDPFTAVATHKLKKHM